MTQAHLNSPATLPSSMKHSKLQVGGLHVPGRVCTFAYAFSGRVQQSFMMRPNTSYTYAAGACSTVTVDRCACNGSTVLH
jgi:hypothetical protein